jgi:hypothetical protein
VLAHGRPPVGYALVVDQDRNVVPDRRLELGLVVHQLEDLHVRLDTSRSSVERLAGNTLGGGGAAQA